MLPSQARLRTEADFRATVRNGFRVARPCLVLHAWQRPGPGSRAGFVVSKAVGNAVTRNLVKRRLRHLVAAEFGHTPVPVDLVVRALPSAATGPLADDFRSAWSATVQRLAR
ncbi:MAG: ribonuclease P protein component [Micropruina sp.]